MTKIIKFMFSAVLLLAFVLMLYPCLGMAMQTEKPQEVKKSMEYDSVILGDERGILTKIVLSIDGGDGYVWGRVRNIFTLLPSVIVVHVELYSSKNYTEDYTQMTFEGRNSILDLNQGETIDIKVSTKGEQKYWKARMRYKFDDRDWVEEETVSILFDANGVCLM